MVVYSNDSRTKKNRREHIVEVAKNLCFERSIGNTTMNDIAKECGMGRSTMYEYFKSKLELMELIRRLYLKEIYDFLLEIESNKTGFEQLENLLIIYANKLFDKYKSHLPASNFFEKKHNHLRGHVNFQQT